MLLSLDPKRFYRRFLLQLFPESMPICLIMAFSRISPTGTECLLEATIFLATINGSGPWRIHSFHFTSDMTVWYPFLFSPFLVSS